MKAEEFVKPSYWYLTVIHLQYQDTRRNISIEKAKMLNKLFFIIFPILNLLSLSHDIPFLLLTFIT